jgi:hypothetical protein
VVDPSTGCAIAQLVPCSSPQGQTVPWKNQGQYMQVLTKTVNNFAKQGLISNAERDSLISAGARSSCGK